MKVQALHALRNARARSWHYLIISLGCPLAIAAGTTVGTSDAYAAGYACFWPQENYSNGCSASASLSTNQATGWKNANGTTRLQTQVKLSVLAGTTPNARVREARIESGSCPSAANCDVTLNVNAGNTYYYFTNGPVAICWRNLAQVTSAASTVTFSTSTYTSQPTSSCP
jgi:hypothetical protein